MRKIRDILRSHFDGEFPRGKPRSPSRSPAAPCCAASTASGKAACPIRFPMDLSDMELEARLYPSSVARLPSRKPHLTKEECAVIHREFQNRSNASVPVGGVPLPESAGPRLFLVLRAVRAVQEEPGASPSATPTRAGRCRSSTTAGRKRDIVDRQTGEVRQVELFVWCWGASNFTYWEFSESQKTWISWVPRTAPSPTSAASPA